MSRCPLWGRPRRDQALSEFQGKWANLSTKNKIRISFSGSVWERQVEWRILIEYEWNLCNTLWLIKVSSLYRLHLGLVFKSTCSSIPSLWDAIMGCARFAVASNESIPLWHGVTENKLIEITELSFLSGYSDCWDEAKSSQSSFLPIPPRMGCVERVWWPFGCPSKSWCRLLSEVGNSMLLKSCQW